MRVSKEHDVRVLFLRRVLQGKIAALHMIIMPVAEEDPVSFEKEQLLGAHAVIITVPADGIERNLRKLRRQLHGILIVVTEMQDAVGLFDLHRLFHIPDIPVGI